MNAAHSARDRTLPPHGERRPRVETAGRPDLRRELLWLVAARLLVVVTLLLTALLIQSVTGAFYTELNPIYYLVGLTFLLSLLYLGLVSVVRNVVAFGYLQLLGDLLIITGFIYYSGGLISPFTFLYIMPILTAAILLPARGGVVMASLASILYGALVAMIYNGLVPSPVGFLTSPELVAPNKVYYNLFVSWLAFFAAALLASYVSEKLRRTGLRLEEQRADLANLQIFYDEVINSMKSGLLSTDMELRALSLNRGGEAILGLEERELLHRPIGEMLRLGAEVRQAIAEAGSDGYRFERSLVAAGRGRRHLSVVGSELRDREGQLKGFTFIFQDVTLVKQLEKELRQSERLAAVGRMAAAIAHEIRNPLASMSGSIQVLKGDLVLSGEQDHLMQIVLNESARLNRTIEDFLFYAKPSPPLRRRLDVSEIVRETATLAGNSEEVGPAHRIQVVVEAEQHVIEADPNQMKQVFWNLVRNALSAMPEGGTLSIHVLESAPGQVAIRFDDEGSGFDPALRERLFEPFHGSTSGGLGLGLAIVYRIVKEHDGDIEIENLEGRGGRVTVKLPAARPRELAEDAPAPLGGHA